MNIERLRKIIAYSDKNHDEIYSMIKRFCSFAGLNMIVIFLMFCKLCGPLFRKKDFWFWKYLLPMMK